MAYRVRSQIIFEWVTDGDGGALLGQQQADQPGYTAAFLPGTVGAAQTTSITVGEIVPGGDLPTGANFQTALNSMATDAYTIITTAGSVPGFTSGTLLALIQAWQTGNP